MKNKFLLFPVSILVFILGWFANAYFYDCFEDEKYLSAPKFDLKNLLNQELILQGCSNCFVREKSDYLESQKDIDNQCNSDMPSILRDVIAFNVVDYSRNLSGVLLFDTTLNRSVKILFFKN